MQHSEKSSNLGLRASVEKKKKLKLWALNNGTTVQGIFDILTDDLLSGKPPGAAMPERPPPSGDTTTEKLIDVPRNLEEGDNIVYTLSLILSELQEIKLQLGAKRGNGDPDQKRPKRREKRKDGGVSPELARAREIEARHLGRRKNPTQAGEDLCTKERGSA